MEPKMGMQPEAESTEDVRLVAPAGNVSFGTLPLHGTGDKHTQCNQVAVRRDRIPVSSAILSSGDRRVDDTHYGAHEGRGELTAHQLALQTRGFGKMDARYS